MTHSASDIIPLDGEKIRRLRMATDESIRTFATRSNVSAATISRLERGLIKQLHFTLVNRIADALEVSIGEIATDEWVAATPLSLFPRLVQSHAHSFMEGARFGKRQAYIEISTMLLHEVGIELKIDDYTPPSS